MGMRPCLPRNTRLLLASPVQVGLISGIEVNAGVPHGERQTRSWRGHRDSGSGCGAEIVQASSAAVSSTIGGRQIFELPFATRNAVELLVTQPACRRRPTRAVRVSTDFRAAR